MAEKNVMAQKGPHQPRQFQHLPTDVQRHILRLVIDPALEDIPFGKSHLTYAQVCRQWKSMVYSLIFTIDLSRFLCKGESNSTRREHCVEDRLDQMVCFLKKNKESIRSLIEVNWVAQNNELISTLAGCWREFLNPEALDKILRVVPQLETLHINLESLCHRTEVVIPSIRGLSLLKKVILDEHTRGWPSGDPPESNVLNTLAESCPALEVLFLGSVLLTVEAMTKIGQLRCLKEFCLYSCDITDRGIQALCNGSGSIELLSLKSTSYLTNQSANAIATGVATQGHLKELRLEWAGTIDDDGLCDILYRCEKLSSLRLWFWDVNVEDAFAQYATRWPSRRLNVRKLYYFVLSGCTF